jgi:hypothetical protein
MQPLFEQKIEADQLDEMLVKRVLQSTMICSIYFLGYDTSMVS